MCDHRSTKAAGRGFRRSWEVFTTMRGRKNPPLDLTAVPEGAPVTFDTMAIAYLQDYQLQRYRSLTTARARVEHLRGFFGGMPAEAMTADRVRDYQLARRTQGFEAGTINRETSALSRMFQLAMRRGLLERMPLFPKRLEENPPRDGFFEHDEYLKVREHLPASYRDVLDFAYYSGWRRNEILGLTWDEVDLKGGVIRLPPRRSKTRTGRVLPISPPLQTVLKRRLRRRQSDRPARLSPRRRPGPRLADGAPRRVPEGEGAASAPARLSANGGAQPDPRRRPGARRDAADRAQDASRV